MSHFQSGQPQSRRRVDFFKADYINHRPPTSQNLSACLNFRARARRKKFRLGSRAAAPHTLSSSSVPPRHSQVGPSLSPSLVTATKRRQIPDGRLQRGVVNRLHSTRADESRVDVAPSARERASRRKARGGSTWREVATRVLHQTTCRAVVDSLTRSRPRSDPVRFCPL